MKVRIGRNVRRRSDAFGGIVYIPSRDDFFAATKDVYRTIAALTSDWKEVNPSDEVAYKRLAELGVCETKYPFCAQRAYSGPSFLGAFPEIPTVSEPLVLNCFSTAHCPLKCIYCHADDLMTTFRSGETDDDLDNVIATASMIPSMVAVITGGDPLTRPDRAERLIRRLAGHKALVLDTSGVGDIKKLLPVLVECDVHVRVSLDGISEVNDRLRPINRKYVPKGLFSRNLASYAMMACLDAGLSVTVQTVVSSRNENMTELLDLRDWIISRGIRHWVLHVAVKGGSARKLEKEAKNKRRGGILPSPNVYSVLWRVVEDTISRELPLDIRCTDTDTSPNSVLLVGSRGDLFTEGYAHNGKVILYNAGQARPDLLAALWPHIDRFGHARRYLNWNPWFFEGRSLEEICVEVPVSSVDLEVGPKQVVETEAKFHVHNAIDLAEALIGQGFQPYQRIDQRDEYFDFADRRLSRLDFVVRLRKDGDECFISLKGPRFFTPESEYSRIELEFRAEGEASFREEVRERNLELTWVFEKRRTSYRKDNSSVIVVIDEVPEIGFFAEVEGSLEEVRSILVNLEPYLGARERRNYREIFVAFKRSQGLSEVEIKGAHF